MRLLSRLRHNALTFRDETRGSIPIEALLAFTFLAWWYVASFQFFDALRQKSINLKAAYTLGDLISRETGPDPADPAKVAVDAAYMNGLNKVFDYLTTSNRPTWIRVSSVYWDATENKNRINWSYATDEHPAQNDMTLQDKAGRIPTMPVGDTVILVETFMAYEPIFNVGLAARWYDTVIVTRPRFASCIPWDHDNCSDATGGSTGADDGNGG